MSTQPIPEEVSKPQANFSVHLTKEAIPPGGKRKWLYVVGLVVAAIIVGWILGGGERVKEKVAYVVGMEAYVYGYPLVMMDVTREVTTAAATSGEYSAPINQFARIRSYVSPDFKNVVRISVNSLWSFGFVDLDAEPMIVSPPDMGSTYIVMQAVNMWTDDVGTAGTRTNSSKAANYLNSELLQPLNYSAVEDQLKITPFSA
jgi:hypothetical protein